jgi:hypothetical protein
MLRIQLTRHAQTPLSRDLLSRNAKSCDAKAIDREESEKAENFAQADAE